MSFEEELPMADAHLEDKCDTMKENNVGLELESLQKQLDELQAEIDLKKKLNGTSTNGESRLKQKILTGAFTLLIIGCIGIWNLLNNNSINSSPIKDSFSPRENFGRKLGSHDPNDVIPKYEKYGESQKPELPIGFTVHFNGNGLEDGICTDSDEWEGLDDLITSLCPQLEQVQEFASYNNNTIERICNPSNGARLFTHSGRRVWSLMDLQNSTRTYIVPQGIQFVYPLGKVGSVIYPENIVSPIKDKPIKLTQLSESPRVFSIENFITDEEIEAILEHNTEMVKPSEVGFSGWQDSTRTSSTAWDFHSWGAKVIQRRSFQLTGLDFDPEQADALQVLRYNKTEWYKPHTDWFDGTSYDDFDPLINNGTNRFATVFLYLTDVEEGGHTVFPLSKTHKGYNGEQLVHPGTEKTAGYISNSDAQWVCNTSSTALRSTTVRGGALLFYNQDGDSSLDKYSLHGGCPVVSGVKWSGNVWLWNRPKPSTKMAKDRKPAPDHNAIQLQFHNKRDESVNLYWDDGTKEMVFQLEIQSGESRPMTTYHSHRFVMRSSMTNQTVSSFVAHDNQKGLNYVHTIN